MKYHKKLEVSAALEEDSENINEKLLSLFR